MYIKWMVPDYGMRGILNGIGRFLFGENDEVHYIGGAEVLPPPLDAGEESVCIRMLATDAAEEARRKLMNTTCGWWYILQKSSTIRESAWRI